MKEERKKTKKTTSSPFRRSRTDALLKIAARAIRGELKLGGCSLKHLMETSTKGIVFIYFGKKNKNKKKTGKEVKFFEVKEET